jgi:hypothetical protein
MLVAFHADLVEVRGPGCVARPGGQVVHHEQLDPGEAAHLGFQVLSRRAALSRLNSLSAGAVRTVRRLCTAMCPGTQAGCVLPTPTENQGAVAESVNLNEAPLDGCY